MTKDELAKEVRFLKQIEASKRATPEQLSQLRHFEKLLVDALVREQTKSGVRVSSARPEMSRSQKLLLSSVDSTLMLTHRVDGEEEDSGGDDDEAERFAARLVSAGATLSSSSSPQAPTPPAQILQRAAKRKREADAESVLALDPPGALFRPPAMPALEDVAGNERYFYAFIFNPFAAHQPVAPGRGPQPIPPPFASPLALLALPPPIPSIAPRSVPTVRRSKHGYELASGAADPIIESQPISVATPSSNASKPKSVVQLNSANASTKTLFVPSSVKRKGSD